jgi:uncharacterized phiE125 gp8 family phage protein
MMISPEIVTEPTVLPVSLGEVKTHLRITHEDHDDLLIDHIKEAQSMLGRIVGRSFHQQTLEMYWDSFPASGALELPRATPLVSVEFAKYRDSDGIEHTWSSSEYVLDTHSIPGSIQPGYGESWPSFTAYPVNAAWVRYAAGKATTSPVTDLDPGIKRGFLLLVNHMYLNPEAIIDTDTWTQMPYALRQAISDAMAPWRF